MTLSIWRYAHLALAILSSAFLLILSITGVILAFDAVQEKTLAYRIENFEEITLAQSLPALRDSYAEILDIKVDHNDFVTIDAMDDEGNAIQAYINPLTGEQLGNLQPKSQFIQWITALHRSLFLKETGRVIVGIISFLLLIITLSGFVLILKRQKGIRHFFDKVNKDFLSQYFHVVSGRISLLPILIIAITGTAIFLVRLDYFSKEQLEVRHQPISAAEETKSLAEIDFFKNTKLANVSRVEFPFIPDDADEPFIIHLNDRSVSINQVNGDIISESKFPYAAVVEQFNLDLHTGRTSIIWAIILGLASLNIVFFIYTGFAITYKRTRSKLRNKFKASESEIIILVGSENGTTLFFANQIQKQLISDGKKAFIAEMNKYQVYPNAEHILVFTSTYGLGDPPSNASQFKYLIDKYPQSQKVNFSVIGFGSRSYADFCAYAKEIDELLANQKWANRLVTLHTINDRSAEEFVLWTQDWAEKSLHALATAPAVYSATIPDLKKFKVVEKTTVSVDNSTFKIILKPLKGLKFDSGDLMAIYPGNDHRERFYSIGRNGKSVQLIVKLYDNGFGSSYLYNLNVGDTINARIMSNPNFHLPQLTTKVAMIANGTGIAPFLGMIHENNHQMEIHLFAGFRHQNSLTAMYADFAQKQINKQHLKRLEFAFSREQNKEYVMDIILREYFFFVNLLQDGGIIMICGSLRMQKDVEKTLNEITISHHSKPIQYYIDRKQILTDCY